MYTLENLFHFLHQLAAIIWLGGVLALNVLQIRLSRGQNRAVLGSLLGVIDLYGRAVIAPAAVITLITGVVLVAQMNDVAWTDFWVVWGFAAIFGSLAIGATLIRATNAELRRLAADEAAGGAQLLTRQRRAASLYAVNLLLLLSAAWAMVFKPTL